MLRRRCLCVYDRLRQQMSRKHGESRRKKVPYSQGKRLDFFLDWFSSQAHCHFYESCGLYRKTYHRVMCADKHLVHPRLRCWEMIVRSFGDFFTTPGPANIDDLHTSETSLKGSYYLIGDCSLALRGNGGFDHYLTRRFADNLFLFALPSS